MTLVMTIIRPEGIWQSTDNRTTLTSGSVIDDKVPKQLHIVCPPLEGGPQVLLGFTGIANMPDSTPIIQWIRETLRGESRVIMEMFEHLRQRLTRDLGGSRLWRYPLTISAGVFDGDKRYYVEINNLASTSGRTQRTFKGMIQEVGEAKVFVAGSGLDYLLDKDRSLLAQQISKRPAKWEDHSGLLAAINRRVAERDPKKRVSPWCSVCYISNESTGGHSKRFSKHGEPAGPDGMDILLAGVDLHEMSALMMSRFRVDKNATIPSDELDSAGKKSIQGRP